jgi:hypothetical protein
MFHGSLRPRECLALCQNEYSPKRMMQIRALHVCRISLVEVCLRSVGSSYFRMGMVSLLKLPQF